MAAAPSEDVRQRLIAFYKKYNPERLPDVDKILWSYRGNEEKLFEALIQRYAPYGDTADATVAETTDAAAAAPVASVASASSYPTPPPPSRPPPASPIARPDTATTPAPPMQRRVTLSVQQEVPATVTPLRRGRGSTIGRTSTPPQSPTLVNVPSEADMAIRRVQANPTEQLIPEKIRTKSIIEVTETSVQQAQQELERINAEIQMVDPLAIQRKMSAFMAAASQLASLDANEDDEKYAHELEADLVAQQSRLVGLLTQLRHATAGFLAIADTVVSYSRQQADLQALRAAREHEAARREAADDGGTVRFAVSDFDQHYHNRQTRPNTGLGTSTTAAEASVERSRASASPQQHNASVQSTAKVVFDVFPLGGERNVVSDVILNQAAPGDVIVLHPGEYRENLVVQGDIEIRCAIDVEAVQAAGNAGRDTVVILPADATAPTLQIVGDGKCRISGVIFKRPRDASLSRHARETTKASTLAMAATAAPAACVPLVSCSGRAHAIFRDSCFVGGGGGIVALGHSEVSVLQCSFRHCTFSAVYSKDGSFMTIANTAFVDCDVALRVRDATFSVDTCDARGCSKDAFVFHGPAKGIIAKTKVEAAAENGVLLSPASEVVVASCLIAKCGKYGVYAPVGSDFAVISTAFQHNAVGDMSRQPSLDSQLVYKYKYNP